MWKLIDGYYWRYRINEDAEVEREIKPNVWRPIAARLGNPHRRMMVHMRKKDGRYTTVPVKRLMVNAFLGGYKPGMLLICKNGMQMDCSLGNLKVVTNRQNGHIYGGSIRKSVEKVDQDGNVLALYSSITEAAKANFVSRTVVSRRCNGEIRDPFLLDGTTYRFEE